MRVNFISSKDTGETGTIYVWSDHKKIMWGSDTDNIIRELFESFLDNYQKELKVISASQFNFESVELMDYKFHKVRLKRGGSYIKSPEWLLYKRATINSKNEKVDKCFQYVLTLALDYSEIKKKQFENIFIKLNMKIRIFHHTKETGKILNKTMKQLLLLYYFRNNIVKK